RGEPLFADGPLLRLAAGLPREIGMQGLELLVILLNDRQPGNRILCLLLESGLFLGEGRLPTLPVLLQRLDLGEQRRALVAEALKLGLGFVEVGTLLAGFFELPLEQLAVGFELR